jgi:hypothetical protein
MARDVFISYQQEDRAAAEHLCAALEAKNVSCWMAPRDICPGQEWASGIIEGLKQCHSFVAILSAQSRNAKQIAVSRAGRQLRAANDYASCGGRPAVAGTALLSRECSVARRFS